LEEVPVFEGEPSLSEGGDGFVVIRVGVFESAGGFATDTSFFDLAIEIGFFVSILETASAIGANE
jgi:hypothetical protein